MAPDSYFQDYVQILSQAIKKIRKIGFKKFNILKDLIDTAQNFLSKQVYGRIQPSNYLLCLILLFGAKNPKLYPILIQTIQKLFSHNFISHNERLNQSLRLIKEQNKQQLQQILILNYQDYETGIFKEIYIKTLARLPQRDDQINLMIVKNYSLIWRMSQSALSQSTIGTIFEFIICSINQNKIQQNTQTLKSAFLQIVRHSFQSYKECLDYKLITDQNDISVKSVCYNYGKVLCDQVAIKCFIQDKYKINDYDVIPDPDPQKIRGFKLLSNQEINQNQQKSGKFGWCINCRRPANYYCKVNRIPVCSFYCKNKSLTEFQMVDKLVNDQIRSAMTFQNHINKICKLFVSYLSGQQVKKTTCFSEIFVFVSTQLKKWNFSKISKNTLRQLRRVFRQTIINVQIQHQAFIGSILSMKKMLFLKAFTQQTQILLKLFAKKLIHFMTPTKIKQQILKVCRQLITSHLLFDYAYIFDCNKDRNDSVKQLLISLTKLYYGIAPPQGIIIQPQQPYIKKIVYELMILIFQQLRKINHPMQKQVEQLKYQQKLGKNLLKGNIQRFNTSQKPGKIIKALIKEKYLENNPLKIANFLHVNIDKLSFSNIGVLIGGYDDIQIKIRDQFIKLINFNNLMIDQGIRKLLKYFTIPGQSQVVQRIIDSFSKIFYDQNRQDNIFHHSDSVYSFSYLLMMLQTNIHNPQVIEKMTLQQFANLSKGMNGPHDFQIEFLQKIYKSIEKTQLGFHQKMKQMQIIIAYKESPKNAQILLTRQLQRQIKQKYQDLGQLSNQIIPNHIYYPIKIYSNQFLQCIIDVITKKINQTEEKQEVIKQLELMENILKFSVQKGALKNIQRGIKNLWDQIIKINTNKKYILMEKFLDWIDLFDQYLQNQWTIVIYLFSKFYRQKLVKKQYSSQNKKQDKMTISQNRCYIYEPFMNSLWVRSSKYSIHNFKCLIEALVQTNKQQINQGSHPYCLQKIGQIQQHNMNRAIDIFPILWPILRDYYIELGKNKNEKTALFGTDFLKQLITKFIKKKDMLNFQKEYIKPLQQIFNSTKLFAVKQYIIGSLTYFINNHSGNIKAGWKVILPILCQAFDEQQDPIIKQKAFTNIKKIYESKFLILCLEENYVDFVQILSRLSHQKDEIYPKGCIQAVKMIIQYYHAKHSIDLQNIQAQSNKNLDIVFWQTYFLPLLSTIYIICGDSRSQVQINAIQLLFGVLMKYGKLFKYEFWKMVLQGVLRPTFEQITYAAQTKSAKKQELQNWLRSSFVLLFSSINQLIDEYFQDFKVFLYDVLKIYQTCILSYSNKILIQLSISSLGELFNKVGDEFKISQWEQFLRFTQSIFKKTLPTQIFSQQNWQKQKQVPEKTYQGKALAMNLFLAKIQQIVDCFSESMQQNIIKEILIQLKKIRMQIRQFNHNIVLRKKLWQDGFYSNLKSLPGLVNQQYQLIKCILTCQFELSILNQKQNLSSYIQTILQILSDFNKTNLYTQCRQQILQRRQKYRQSIMLRVLILFILKRQLNEIQIQKINQYKYKQKVFQQFLEISYKRSFCSYCKFCQNCQMNLLQQKQFNDQIKKYLKKIFNSNK